VGAEVSEVDLGEADSEAARQLSWEDGYFARTVGDEVVTVMITRYIRFHEEREKQPEQLRSD